MQERSHSANSNIRTEIAIVGGGLAGGLIALALRRQHPEMEVMLIEAGEMLGGNHRWSWFDSDLDAAGTDLLSPFRKTEWHGYEVHFPQYKRKLDSTYRSLTSADFDAALRRELGQQTIYTSCPVASLDAGGVTLENGQRISARTVIDCRSSAAGKHFTGGWQIFMGRLTRTAKPHGIDRPIIMDATVEQLAPYTSANGKNDGAYRFVYVLPLGANELFVEDTYYADEPVLDRSALSGRIDQYCRQHGWEGEILGGESGILPVITGGAFPAYQADQKIGGVSVAGARGGFLHPLSSYTLPFAVETALAIADDALLPGEQLAALLEVRARRHWKRTWFYRKLGSMLFGAAEPAQRYKIFEHFYRLSETLVERFYAGNSTFPDKARVLIGKPPVSVSRAIKALIGKGEPLARSEERTK